MSSVKFSQMEFSDNDTDVDYTPEDERLVLHLVLSILVLLVIHH